MATLLEDMYAYVVDLGQRVATGIKDAAGDLWTTLADTGGLLTEWLKEQFTGLTSLVHYVSDKVKAAGHTQFTILVEKKDRVWTKIGDSFTLVAETLTDKAKEVGSDVLDAVGSLTEDIWLKINDIIDLAVQGLGDKIDAIREYAENIIEEIKEGLSAKVAEFKEYLDFPEQLFASLAEISDERWEEVGDFFVKLMGRILSYATRDIELKG